MCFWTLTTAIVVQIYSTPDLVVPDLPPLQPGDVTCILNVVPGKHPVHQRWSRFGKSYQGYSDGFNSPDNQAQPE